MTRSASANEPCSRATATVDASAAEAPDRSPELVSEHTLGEQDDRGVPPLTPLVQHGTRLGHVAGGVLGGTVGGQVHGQGGGEHRLPGVPADVGVGVPALLEVGDRPDEVTAHGREGTAGHQGVAVPEGELTVGVGPLDEVVEVARPRPVAERQRRGGGERRDRGLGEAVGRQVVHQGVVGEDVGQRRITVQGSVEVPEAAHDEPLLVLERDVGGRRVGDEVHSPMEDVVGLGDPAVAPRVHAGQAQSERLDVGPRVLRGHRREAGDERGRPREVGRGLLPGRLEPEEVHQRLAVADRSASSLARSITAGGRALEVAPGPGHLEQPEERVELGELAGSVASRTRGAAATARAQEVLGADVGDPADGDVGGRLRARRRPGRPTPTEDGPPEVLGEDLGVVDAGAAGLDGVGHPEVEAGPAQRR